jgi:hypothetical protein
MDGKRAAAGIGLALSWLGGAAHAQEIEWRAVRPRAETPAPALVTPAATAVVPRYVAPAPPLAADDDVWTAVRPAAPRPVAATPPPRSDAPMLLVPVAAASPPPAAPALAPPPPGREAVAVVEDAGPWHKVRAQNDDDLPRLPARKPSPVPAAAAPAAPRPAAAPTGYPPPGYAAAAPPAVACPPGARPITGGFVGSQPITLSPDYVGVGLAADPVEPVRAPRGYLRAEYLFWDVTADRVPPLATTSPAMSMGILGQPGTVVLFGGDELPSPFRSGGRFFAGLELDPCTGLGVEVGGFFLGRRGFDFAADSRAFPSGVLARPFFAPNVSPANNLPGEFVELVGFPGLATGRLDIGGSTALYGLEANLTKPVCCGCTFNAGLLAGFRYLDLNENLRFQETILQLAANGTTPAGSFIIVRDGFETHNQFYGGQLGANLEWTYDRFFVNLMPKVALGVTHQRLTIDGGQSVTPPGGPTATFIGGLLATPSNIGTFEKDRFSVVPEVTFSVGYYVTSNLRAFVGYNALFWSNVIRPGTEIDRVIDLTNVPNSFFPGPPAAPNRPMPLFDQNGFWAHGVNFGLEYRW